MPSRIPRTRFNNALWALCRALGLTGLAVTAGAAGPSADPLRPPNAMPPPIAFTAARPGPAANATTEPSAEAEPQVQAVHLPARGAATAMVDGQPVRVGDTLRQRKVLAIDHQGLVLQAPKGTTGKTTERLWLLGSPGKQAAGSTKAGKTWDVPRYVASGAASTPDAANPPPAVAPPPYADAAKAMPMPPAQLPPPSQPFAAPAAPRNPS
jgi:hypothetical protein